MRAWVLCLVFVTGCRAFHETAIKQRLVETRFFQRDVQRPLPEVDTLLVAHRLPSPRVWCELCVVSAETLSTGARQYCLTSHEEKMCVVAKPAGPGTTRFEALEAQHSSGQVIRALWNLLEPQESAAAEVADADELAFIAADEEAHFVSRWSFAVGAKVGAVVSYDPITFTFGAHVGFRYWGSNYVIPGAVIEVENMLQGARSLVTSSALARVELALWSDDNLRFVNLPRVSFMMGFGPLVGFGHEVALGGRAVVGIHLIHLTTFLTPFFFEAGFQAIEVDRQSASGLRVALGLGF